MLPGRLCTVGALALLLVVGCQKPSSIQSRSAMDHTEVGNGGDLLALEFITRARFALSYLERARPQSLLSLAELEALRQAIRQATIMVVDEELRDNQGTVQTAVTETRPGARAIIRINRLRWQKELEGSLDQRGFVNVVRMVFHEFLRAAGINDDNYRLSDRLPLAEADYLAWRRETVGLEPDATFFDSEHIRLDPALMGTGVLWLGTSPCHAFTVLRSGKMLTAGAIPHFGANPGSTWQLHRFHEWGSLDRSFGTQGRAELAHGRSLAESITNVLEQSNEKVIVVSGSIWRDAAVELRRFRRDGTLDTREFGTNGTFTLPRPCRLQGAALLSDDSILVVGSAPEIGASEKRHAAVFRIQKNGGLVFGLELKLTESEELPTAFLVQPDNKILVAGTADGGKWLTLAKLLPSGAPDGTFGHDANISFNGPGKITGIALQRNGEIVLAANRVVDAVAEGILVRLTPSGRPDLSFGQGGSVRVSRSLLEPGPLFHRSSRLEIAKLVVDANDEIVVAGPVHEIPADPTPRLVTSAMLRIQRNGTGTNEHFGNKGYDPLFVPGGGPGILTELVIDRKNRLLPLIWTTYRGYALERQLAPR